MRRYVYFLFLFFFDRLFFTFELNSKEVSPLPTSSTTSRAHRRCLPFFPPVRAVVFIAHIRFSIPNFQLFKLVGFHAFCSPPTIYNKSPYEYEYTLERSLTRTIHFSRVDVRQLLHRGRLILTSSHFSRKSATQSILYPAMTWPRAVRCTDSFPEH